jgi:hypothetical protein
LARREIGKSHVGLIGSPTIGSVGIFSLTASHPLKSLLGKRLDPHLISEQMVAAEVGAPAHSWRTH